MAPVLAMALGAGETTPFKLTTAYTPSSTAAAASSRT
jgi:membrane carboxypeptidase/penicillin-binding protein